MKKRLNILIAFAMMLMLSSYGQEKYNIVQKGGNGMAPRAIDFDAAQNGAKKSSFSSPENFMSEHFDKVPGQGVIISEIVKDELGFTHYRLQQSINGIPVESSMYLIHVKNGQVTSANGEWFTATPAKSFAKSSTLSSAQALQKAKDVIKAKQYVWEARAPRANNKTFRGENVSGEGELVYITKNNAMNADALRLAYKFDMYSVEPFGRKEVFVDASNGEILFIEEKIHHVDGTTDTGYYGPQNITVTQNGGRYEMRQSGDRKLALYDMQGAQLQVNATQTAIIEPTNTRSIYSSQTKDFKIGGEQNHRTAAYWGAEKTWDMFKNEFNRSSYDNRGSNINIYVNGAGRYGDDNAFWSGTWMYFGNTKQLQGTPVTPLDVVGHEMAHGVTQETGKMVYQGESGALNESYSDMFGSLVEYYTFNKVVDAKVWKLADKHPDQRLKRDLSNPKLHNQPDTYRGTKWVSTAQGSADNGGVHTNSGVMNHWFYIVSQGAKGSNDSGTAYDVEGIGIEKAGKIAYRSLTNYLTRSSKYADARNAVINATKDLHGANSCEVKVVTNAMNAVGVGAKFTGNANCDGGGDCSAVSGVAASNITKNGATINWNAVTGITTYTFEYKKTADASYTTSSVTGTSKTLDGLTVDTAYEVRLKYACTNGETAPYSTVVKFTTAADGGGGDCNAVTGVNSSNITINSATVSWTSISGVSNYTFEYKKAADASYTASTVSGATTNLTGLAANTKYEARVKYTCSTDGGTDPCAGVPAYQAGNPYKVGDKVTYQGYLFEFTNTGWQQRGQCGTTGGNQVDAPYSAVISFTTLEDTNGNNCDNIPEYQPGNTYPVGSKVKYFGTIYELTATGWVVIGSCDSAFFASAFRNNLNNTTGFNVYPNPASKDLNISFKSLDNVSSQIRIVNILGKVVYNKEVKSTLGNNTIKVDVSRLNSGIYFVKRGNQDVKKVIIK
ncbi:M4 family metallopeptidase [Aquimarina megaterium]|uniref:M4 family metallopeptidase n=1 Tax=Aquimarina megaterium TaxID=1443666 RepID=UPI000943EF95|nr:M4 family metallopeptidase [Aquimarina megaterium]